MHDGDLLTDYYPLNSGIFQSYIGIQFKDFHVSVLDKFRFFISGF